MHKQIKIDDDTLDAFIELIENNHDNVLYDYKGKENQILLKCALVGRIESFIQENLPLDTYGLKDFLKAYIRAAFELKDNAVVISKNGNIFIKIIDETVKKKVEEKDKGTVKGRFNGVKEEELEAFYNEFFTEEKNKNFFHKVAYEFVHKYLIERKITNDEFEKNIFSYIHTITFKTLTSIYDEEEAFFLGFAGYVFRIHFEEVFAIISELILDEIASSNPYIIEFVNYYSQDVLVINGLKYKIPHIEAKNGLRWTVPSMLSIVKIYTKAKHSIQKLKQEESMYQSRVEKFHINGNSPIKFNELLVSERAGIEIELEHAKRLVNVLSDRIDVTKDKMKKKLLQNELSVEKNKLKELQQKKEATFKKAIKQSVISQYITLQKELDTVSRKLQRERKILKQNEESYTSIKNALAKALISKKSRL